MFRQLFYIEECTEKCSVSFMKSYFLSPACIWEWKLIALLGVVKVVWTNSFEQWHGSYLLAFFSGQDSASSLLCTIVHLLMGPAATCPHQWCPTWKCCTILELQVTVFWQAMKSIHPQHQLSKMTQVCLKLVACSCFYIDHKYIHIICIGNVDL